MAKAYEVEPGSLKGKVAVVTGANTGMGRVTALQLARGGAHVVMVCRSRERGEEARADIAKTTGNDGVELVVADLASLAQTRRAASEILAKHPKVHILVNNAAVFLPKREVTEEGFEKTFATNYLSHFVLTNLLLGALQAAAPARIVNVATLTRGLSINLDDLQLEKSYGIMTAVPQTKLALILMTRVLDKRLAGTGVTVNALHPGMVKTPLLDEMPWLMRKLAHLMSTTPEVGASTQLWLATSKDVEGVSGKLFADCKESKLTGQAADLAFAEKFWDLSAKLAGLEGEQASAAG